MTKRRDPLTQLGKLALHEYRERTGNELTPVQFAKLLRLSITTESVCCICDHAGTVYAAVVCAQCRGRCLT